MGWSAEEPKPIIELKGMDIENKPGPLEWDHLDPYLKVLLPSEKGDMCDHRAQSLTYRGFSWSPEYSYDATVRINLADKGAAQSWMQKMMQHRGQNKVFKMGGHDGQPILKLVGHLLHLLGHATESRSLAISSLCLYNQEC